MSFDQILLAEKFDDLRVAPMLEANDGPYREMHARPLHPDDNMGEWQCKVGHWSLGQVLWECIDTPNGKRMRSCPTATVADNVSIAKGDFDWQDIKVDAEFTLQPKGKGWGGTVGMLFRFLDSTRYYAAVVDRDGQAKILKRIVGNCWNCLAMTPITIKEGEPFAISVEVVGDQIKAQIGDVELTACDGEYANGLIGLIGAQPVEVGPITVKCTKTEQARLAEVKQATVSRLAKKQKACGQPKLWKKIDTTGFGSGRRIRLGDLTGDGQLDLLLTRTIKRGLVYMVAMDIDGKVMWEQGDKPPVPTIENSSSSPVQVHDIDGDGKAEIICAFNDELQILDGATGKVKKSVPMPVPTKLPDVYKDNTPHWGGLYDDHTDFLPASSVTLADFSGVGRPTDIILSGSYHQTMVFNSDLQELWRHTNIHGHFPAVYRPAGETRDHLLNGFHHLDADGKLCGKVCMQDHQDAIYVGPMDDEAKGDDVILMASGEDGLLVLTPDYNIHNRVMGHVQRLSIGKFRQDIPGLCVATVLFHHNRGIISLYDSTLKHLWTRDYPVVGSTLQPILFDDSGEERMLYSGIRPAQGHQGGLIDGQGELVSLLPDDGGPGLCALGHDLDGDGLDEIMVWDHDQIWIYHSDAEVDAAKLMQRERPPLYNMSNFQSYWSRQK